MIVCCGVFVFLTPMSATSRSCTHVTSMNKKPSRNMSRRAHTSVDASSECTLLLFVRSFVPVSSFPLFLSSLPSIAHNCFPRRSYVSELCVHLFARAGRYDDRRRRRECAIVPGHPVRTVRTVRRPVERDTRREDRELDARVVVD